jgi:hypothetical protein
LVLQVISNDYFIASNPETSIQVLIELILKNGHDISQLATTNLSQKLALNSDIPGSLLEKCAEINQLDIKIGLLRHPNVPVSVLHQLAASSSFRLRRLLSQNPNLDASLFEILLQDKHQEVRHVALENFLRTKQKWEYSGLREFLREWEAVQNSSTPAEKLMELSVSKWVLIREAVALHPQTAMLLGDGDGFISLSKKPVSTKKYYTPATLLEKLAKDKNPAVKMAVARNIDTPINLLEDLLRNQTLENSIHITAMKNAIARYPEQASLYLGQYFHSPQSLSRFFILLHPLAPTSLLKKHFRSSSWLERYAIGKNPNTPPHIREYLTRDANKIVRAAAKKTLDTKY